MTIFLLSLFLMLAAIAGMSIGLILGRTRIRGSCGALTGVDGGAGCGFCRQPCARRRAASTETDGRQRPAPPA